MRIDLGGDDPNRSSSSLRDALSLIQFLEEKDEKAKAKDKDKEKKQPSKSGGDIIGNVVLLTLLQFGIGPLTVWFWTYMMNQSMANLQHLPLPK